MISRASCLACLLGAAIVSTAHAQSTAFTYQGRLKNGGSPAGGLYDLRFTLFNAATAGLVVGSPQCVDNITVTDGLFTASIDFGQAFTTATSLFIQIEARADTGLGCGNSTGFIVLSPRQTVTAAPMATHAKSAYALDAADGSPTNAVFVDNTGRVGIGTTTPTHSVHIANPAPTLALQDTGPQQVGYVSYRDSANIETAWVGYGTEGDPDFSIVNARTGGDIVLNPFSGNVGIGTAAPTARLDVRGGPIQVEAIGDQADALWLATERSWVFRQEGAGAGTALKLQSVGGGGNKNFIIQTDGLVGIGTTTPAAKLDVRGDIRLGPSGEFRATGGSENLRMLRGSIDGNGTIDAGEGFTSEHVGTGLYRITFDVPFASIPSVTLSAVQPYNASPRWATFVQSTSNAAFIDVFVMNGNSSTTNSDFHFIVMGPR